MTIQSINTNYSTTRRLSNAKPQIQQSSETKFERLLFLPPHPERKGEGGLRQQGYFKTSDSDQGVKKYPLITVITVVFNGAATLAQSTLSIINQSYDNVEYIIIDGGSTDGTLDIIRKYEHAIDYWVSEPDAGIYDAFNKAVKCAGGDWLCVMGADDYLWDEDVLGNMVPAMLLARPNFKLVYGCLAIVNARQQFIYRVGEPWKIAKGKLGDFMSIPHPGLMHHRTWFENYGLFDTSYRIAGDYEMLLRGWPKENAVFVPDVIVAGVTQGGVSSTPQNAIRQLKEVWRAQKMHGRRFPGRHLTGAFFRVYVRLVLQAMLGERVTYRLLDMGRRMIRKEPCWTKS